MDIVQGKFFDGEFIKCTVSVANSPTPNGLERNAANGPAYSKLVAAPVFEASHLS